MKRIITIKKDVGFLSHAAVGGYEESVGKVNQGFDFFDTGDSFGMDTWEKSEWEMGRIALNFALNKARVSHSEIELLAAGDLQNQCAATTLGLKSFGIPFIGLYGACSTCTEGLAVLSCIMNTEEAPKLTASVTTSHNAAAERQFRMPLEYGGQRARSAQWTATASGAFILKNERRAAMIKEAMFGIPIDGGTPDATKMGPAMAFAAYDSVKAYFSSSELSSRDFDAVVTGDLGLGGSSLFCELISRHDPYIADLHLDCGLLLYDENTQDSHSGASGCGVSASVLSSYFLPKIESGELSRILFLSTGALMSPTSSLQGENIAGIAPAVRIDHVEV